MIDRLAEKMNAAISKEKQTATWMGRLERQLGAPIAWLAAGVRIGGVARIDVHRHLGGNQSVAVVAADPALLGVGGTIAAHFAEVNRV